MPFCCALSQTESACSFSVQNVCTKCLFGLEWTRRTLFSSNESHLIRAFILNKPHLILSLKLLSCSLLASNANVLRGLARRVPAPLTRDEPLRTSAREANSLFSRTALWIFHSALWHKPFPLEFGNHKVFASFTLLTLFLQLPNRT